jgi:hypothetical protein
LVVKKGVIAMDSLITDSGAMTLTLLVAVAVLVGTVYLILMGGRQKWTRGGAKPKSWLRVAGYILRDNPVLNLPHILYVKMCHVLLRRGAKAVAAGPR